MHVAKTKMLIGCAVTAQLICTFVFIYANHWFSHAQAHFKTLYSCTVHIQQRSSDGAVHVHGA